MRLAGVLGLGLARAGSVFNAIVATGSTLLDGLVSYWPLNEVSGTRADAVGDNDLTDNNTVGVSLAGPSGTVASFVGANSEWLSASISAPAANYTVATWFYNDGGLANYQGIFKLGSADAYPNIGIAAYGLSGGDILVEGLFDGTVNAQITPVLGWNLLVVEQDHSTFKVHYSLNGAALSSTAASSGTARACDRFFIGRIGTDASHYADFSISKTGFWSGLLGNDVVASLFNSGVAKAYADLTTAEKVGLVSYWDLSETSGTRVDAHGSNDLSDNNTVGSVINSGGAMHNAAASFVAANSETLSADTVGAGITGSAGVTIAGWTYTTSAAVSSTFWSLGKAASGGGTGWLYAGNLGSATEASIIVDDDVTAIQLAAAACDINNWHLVVTWYNPTDKKGYIQVDNGTPVATGALTNHPVFTTGDNAKYLNGNYLGGAYFMQGRIDETAIWSRVLTADERTELWNAGRGKFYPFSS